jgi:hypothetical protein
MMGGKVTFGRTKERQGEATTWEKGQRNVVGCVSEGWMELEANDQEKGRKGMETRSGLLGSVGGGDGDEDGLKVTRVEEGEARREERSSLSIRVVVVGGEESHRKRRWSHNY